ncbi:MAG TPA: M48 family metalloprotease [Flavisolibacter sp.]|nr:M48 family metalloprotease [Flavisolibacter sp.]
MKNLFLFTCLSLSAILFTNCARNPVTGNRQVVLMSEAQEIQMGQEADPQIIAQFGLYNDQNLQNFINQRGQAMAKISHRPNIQYNFRVINSEAINAFAVPGGYVYFTRGIMAHFNNEAEFMGVLGHEIGHITARHTVAQQRNALLGQIGLIAGMVLAPGLAQFGELASQGLGLLLLKYGRDAERQSDELGVEYSTKVGFDAREMADFFTTLERKGEESGQAELPSFLSTHPNPGDRQTTVARLATQYQQKLNVTNPQVNRESYLRMIDGLIYGEDPKEGFLEAGIFYHPELRFQFAAPTNWAYQNSPTQVQFASRDGKAMMLLTLGKGSSLNEAASAFVQQYKMQVVQSDQTTVNGFPALSVVADLQQQQGVLRTQSMFIQYGTNIYQMLGVSSSADFGAYRNVFLNSMQSFRTLTDQAKINKKADRIRIKTVTTAGTLDQALRSFGMPANRLNELSLLNGMQLSDRVTAGMLIKVLGQ